MNQLKRKIRTLDRKMNAETASRAQDLYLLKRYLKKPAVLAGGLIASLAVGVFMGRKGGIKQMIKTALATPLFVIRAVKNIQLLSWFH